MTWSRHSDAIPSPGHDGVGQACPKKNLGMRSEAMSYKHTAEKLADYRRQIRELRQNMRDVQAAIEPEPVKDYTFRRASGGSGRRSALVGDKNAPFVIHNMGQSCPYCTLWADGFNGAYAHLSNRAAFVVSSPDTPEKQRKFAESRHWTFPMVSHEGTTFAEDRGDVESIDDLKRAVGISAR